MTQVPYKDLVSAHIDQRHDPLYVLSGHFSATEARWSTLEKSLAVIHTLKRLHWRAATSDGFLSIYRSQQSLYLFDSLLFVPDISQTILRKVLREAIRLCTYDYTCVDIRGMDNVWADLIERWAPPPTIRRIVCVPPLSSAAANEVLCPTTESIAIAQETVATVRPKDLANINGLWTTVQGATWIPDDSMDLQVCLFIIAHITLFGHSGLSATESV